MRDRLFIVHSYRDVKWLERLKVFLKPIARDTRIVFYDDLFAGLGWAWKEELEQSLASAKVCLLLVSADFITSELMAVFPSLLRAAARKGTTVIWLPLSASPVKETEIHQYQAAIDPALPLNKLPAAKRDRALSEVVKLIASHLKGRKPPAAKGRGAARPAPARAARRPAAESRAAPAAPAPDIERTFVCYAREDQGFVLKLASDLKAGGVNVWLDRWDIPGGENWNREIDKALKACRHFMIVLSPNAVGSDEVLCEMYVAVNRNKHVVPVLYKACEIPRRLVIFEYADFTAGGGGRAAALKKLLHALTPKGS